MRVNNTSATASTPGGGALPTGLAAKSAASVSLLNTASRKAAAMSTSDYVSGQPPGVSDAEDSHHQIAHAIASKAVQPHSVLKPNMLGEHQAAKAPWAQRRADVCHAQLLSRRYACEFKTRHRA